jgi:3-oxoacyl-[acyl-carrier protein] reductase
MSKLKGKVALVTGASKGIGAAIAKALAAEGAAVAVNYASSKAGADKIVAEITQEATVKQFGRLDVLVNNSGVYEFAPLEQISEESFERQFGVNVRGLLFTTQAAAQHLGQGSSVINVGSVVSRTTPPGSAVYTGTKGAVDAITGVLARELGPRQIRVNALNPGIIETEGSQSAGFIGSDFEKAIVAQTPLGRTGQPQDIAAIAVFLASNDSQWLTGEQLLAGGGLR